MASTSKDNEISSFNVKYDSKDSSYYNCYEITPFAAMVYCMCWLDTKGSVPQIYGPNINTGDITLDDTWITLKQLQDTGYTNMHPLYKATISMMKLFIRRGVCPMAMDPTYVYIKGHLNSTHNMSVVYLYPDFKETTRSMFNNCISDILNLYESTYGYINLVASTKGLINLYQEFIIIIDTMLKSLSNVTGINIEEFNPIYCPKNPMTNENFKQYISHVTDTSRDAQKLCFVNSIFDYEHDSKCVIGMQKLYMSLQGIDVKVSPIVPYVCSMFPWVVLDMVSATMQYSFLRIYLTESQDYQAVANDCESDINSAMATNREHYKIMESVTYLKNFGTQTDEPENHAPVYSIASTTQEAPVQSNLHDSDTQTETTVNDVIDDTSSSETDEYSDEQDSTLFTVLG